MSAAAVREGEVRTGQAKVAMRRDDGQMANWMDDGRGEATAATAYMDEVQVGDGPACRDGLGEVFGGGSKVWVECLSRLANGSSDAGALVGEQPATVRGRRAGTVLQALRVLAGSSCAPDGTIAAAPRDGAAEPRSPSQHRLTVHCGLGAPWALLGQ
ncbi:hypothetical protein BBK36DRAFT_1141870 [Trichoderma citrinoviride]|uniref:Uncharacterized protein n=1 Tax=Trichoderma citrinoviride TaxID=58853 RepID=A0A2T4B9R8_9HYPO|nr:hypothetical protein BBK36DRAFT_1141870 [Trichoderma citrinoviride]PTB65949.1 hypothetical protein BBK36DRAFT_1141870 [Trichoderma citrinoviride]